MEIDAKTSNRLAKMSFICALLVVVLHVGIGPAWIKRVFSLTGIAVPFFFLAAGFLFAGRIGEEGWYARQCKSRFKSLVIPYVIWNLLYWAFVFLLTVLMEVTGREYGGLKLICALMYAPWDVLGLCPFTFSSLGLLWFVRCLIVLVVLSPLFVIFTKRHSWILALTLYMGLVAWNYYQPVPNDNWVRPWVVEGWMRSVVYFGAGICIRHFGVNRLALSLPVGALLFVAGWALLWSDTCLWSTLGVPIAMLGLWNVLSGQPWPKWLTGCAFPIYVLHAFMGIIASVIITAVGMKPEYSVVAFAIKWLIMAGGSIAATCVFRRYLPLMAQMIFGGR